MHNKIMVTTGFFLGCLLINNTLQADTSLTFTSTNQGMTRTSTIQIQGSRIRMKDVGNATYTIYDSEKETLYTLNPTIKQYTETTIDSIKKNMTMLMENQKVVKAQMKEQLSKMPEEQRVAIEKQMQLAEKQAKTALPKIEMQTTGETETIQGVTCSVMTAAVADKLFKKTCLAKDGIDKSDIAQLKRMFRFMENTTIETAKIRGLPVPDEASMPSHQDGFAIKTQMLTSSAESILSKVSGDSLNKNDFLIPKVYTLFIPPSAPAAEKK